MMPLTRDCRVLICHPGRQYSDRLASALHKHRRLAGYWSGIPTQGRLPWWLPQALAQRFLHHNALPLPAELLEFCYMPTLTRNFARRLLPDGLSGWAEYWGYWHFDAWSASRLTSRFYDTVVGYENACARTFLRARALGMRTVLDAAALHHDVQDRMLREWERQPRLGGRIRKQKLSEVDLADHILVTSDFARSSYVRAGVDERKIHVVPLGADVERFHVPRHRPRGCFRFLFVGYTGFRKGTDVLMRAFETVSNHRVKLTFAGRSDPSLRVYASARDLNVEWLGQLHQELLAVAFHEAHCLVLPSRIESFGMVVVEALASGLPVIVTDHVGAQGAVTPDTGWIVPAGDVSALAARMRWCVENAGVLEGMRQKCRRMAETFSWRSYEDNVHKVFDEMCS